jgi:hypothetical protein
VNNAQGGRIGVAQAEGVGPGGDGLVMPAGQLRAQPVEHGPLPAVGPGGGGARRLVVEQVKLVVAAQDRPAARQDEVDHRRGERPPVDDIARDDDLVNGELGQVGQVGQDGLQGGQVAVNVREDGEARHGRRPGGASRRPAPA